MKRLFHYLVGNENKEEVKVKVTHYENTGDPKEDYNSLPYVYRCAEVREFEELYIQLGRERNKLLSKIPDVLIKIELQGKFNGRDIKEEFNNLQSYYEYLEKNILSNKTSFKLQ